MALTENQRLRREDAKLAYAAFTPKLTSPVSSVITTRRLATLSARVSKLSNALTPLESGTPNRLECVSPSQRGTCG